MTCTKNERYDIFPDLQRLGKILGGDWNSIPFTKVKRFWVQRSGLKNSQTAHIKGIEPLGGNSAISHNG
jgi:cell division inhibitor SulA